MTKIGDLFLLRRSYKIDHVKIAGLHRTTDGRRFLIYATIIDSFNNHPGVFWAPRADGLGLYFLHQPVEQPMLNRPDVHPAYWLSDWEKVVGREFEAPPYAVGQIAQFTEVPVDGRLFVTAFGGASREIDGSGRQASDAGNTHQH